MKSWIYLYSHFTSEALLIEATLILTLCCLYTAFWALRKRKYGSLDESVPAESVKTYLNELIGGGQDLRKQLFGIVDSEEIPRSKFMKDSQDSLGDTDSLEILPEEVKNQFTLLEAKIAEQADEIQSLASEKNLLEKTLKKVRAEAEMNAGPADVKQLKTQVVDLQDKLSEYSVLEEDLASLKQLEQENTKLKTLLISKGIPLPEEPSTEELLSETDLLSEDALSESDLSDETLAGLKADELLKEASDSQASQPTPSSDSNNAKGNPTTTPGSSSASAPMTQSKGNAGKKATSEADLVAEFEKMLKS